MAQQAERMQSLVSDLLTLSKLEGSPAPNRQGLVLTSQLIDKCVADAQGLSEVLAGGSHRFTSDVSHDAQLAGSVDELSSALGNLLSNAVRYTPAGGCIDVRFEVLPDGSANLSVTDTGPGIAPEHLPRLTERFYRVDRSRSRETGGTGLGLPITKQLVELMGGVISVESQPGQGASFTVELSLPIGKVPDAVPAPPVLTVAARRLLIVDDTPAHCEILLGQLRGRGFAADTAGSGMRALAMTALISSFLQQVT